MFQVAPVAPALSRSPTAMLDEMDVKILRILQVDYLLHVVVPDIAAYDAFYKKLIARIEISKVSSAFAMEQIKYTTALPLDFALGRQTADVQVGARRSG